MLSSRLSQGKFDSALNDIFLNSTKTTSEPTIAPLFNAETTVSQGDVVDSQGDVDMETLIEETPPVPEAKSKVQGEFNEPRKLRYKKEHQNTLQKLKDQQKNTLFVGNVPLKLKQKHALVSEFKTIFKVLGEIESIRFRSIALEKPINRKIAVLSKMYHPNRDSMNAYIVYKQSVPESYSSLNGILFHEHHLKVDRVDDANTNRDTKKTVFVGNLPLDVEDEAVHSFFKVCGDIDYVRIVRDRCVVYCLCGTYLLFVVK